MESRIYNWPGGYTCAAAITVNLDAEFYGRIFYPGVDVDEGDINRLGVSGMKFGLPRLLNTLKENEVKATFFIPGEVALRYPEKVREIAAQGHEIACRGMEHEVLGAMSAQEQRDVLKKAKETIREITGVDPTGFRMPTGEITEETLRIVKELGFTYSSSLSDDDLPYLHNCGTQEDPVYLPELPIHWVLNDLQYFTFAFDPPIPPGSSRNANTKDVLKNFLYEIEGAQRWGTLVNFQLDPQTIGEQGRIFILETVIRTIKKNKNMWLATCSEIAQTLN